MNKTIKILTPVSKPEEIEPLIKAGADEFYAGVFSKEWHNKYKIGNVNDRDMAASNFKSFDELKKAVEIANSYNTNIHFTLNRMGIIQEQYPFAISQAKEAIKAGVDSIIVADLGLIHLLQKFNVDLHVSTLGTIFNSETAKFYKKYGIKRVVLPRHITIKEVMQIKKGAPGLELEAFILNAKCPGEEGFCTFHHRLDNIKSSLVKKRAEKFTLSNYLLKNLKKLPLPLTELLRDPIFAGHIDACIIPYKINIISKENLSKELKKRMINNIRLTFLRKTEQTACGACALYDFKKIGVSSVKIVGRGFPLAKRIKDVSFIRKSREIALSKNSRTAAIKKIQEIYQKDYEKVNSCKISACYYPEVLQ